MDNITIIPIGKLHELPTNVRTAMDETKIQELSESIKLHGVIQPLVVKESTGEYLVVCGNRRLRASKIAGLKELPCIVRELNDEEIANVQLNENLQREDLSLIDECQMFVAMTAKGYSTEMIATTIGKSAKYVGNRLRINNLIPSLQSDILEGFLPLSHALLLSEFPADVQEQSIKRLYGNIRQQREVPVSELDEEEREEYGVGEFEELEEGEEPQETVTFFETIPSKTSLERLSNLSEWIKRNYTFSLNRAIFDLDDKTLPGGACSVCPKRSGINGKLFTDDDETISCLDSACFNNKRKTTLSLNREVVAKKHKIPVENVAMLWHQYEYDKANIAEGFMPRTTDFCRIIEDHDNQCENLLPAIDGENGKEVTICPRSSGCKEHFYFSKSSDSSNPEAELQAKRERKEEIFDVKVGDQTRFEVITESAKEWAVGMQMLSNRPRHILQEVLDSLVRDCKDTNRAQVLLLKRLGIEIYAERWEAENSIAERVKRLSDEQFLQSIFVLSNYWKGEMWQGFMSSQTPVVEMAQKFRVDYDLIDAKHRLELAPKKEKDKFRAYLQQVTVKDPNAQIPRIWAQSYVPDWRKQPEPPTATENEAETPEIAKPKITLVDVIIQEKSGGTILHTKVGVIEGDNTEVIESPIDDEVFFWFDDLSEIVVGADMGEDVIMSLESKPYAYGEEPIETEEMEIAEVEQTTINPCVSCGEDVPDFEPENEEDVCICSSCDSQEEEEPSTKKALSDLDLDAIKDIFGEA